MGLPRTLKNMILSQNGGPWIGQIPSITLPKLARKLEEYRGGGMDGTVKLDMGQEAMQLEFSAGGPIKEALAAWGGSLTGTMLRFSGAYQQDDTGTVTAIDVVVQGRYEELDQGEQKIGDPGSFKGTLAVAYYRQDWDGVTVIEIDILNMVCMVDGVDVLAAQRNALGI